MDNEYYYLYDFDKLHAFSKIVSIIILGISIVGCIITLIITGSYLYPISLALTLGYCLIKKVQYINNPMIIEFTEKEIRLNWHSPVASVDENIEIKEIKEIKLARYYREKCTKFTVKIYLNYRNVEFQVSSAQQHELYKFFERYCQFHDIPFFMDK